ncbi:beta-lactamase [Salinarimonas ramus]|uniref:Beta-lactamase n=1 Tax=Salinarimonas ramus TaxID=690164 RepID=A0A917QJH0_9HYPH|nr:beta-lactamase [Salinarimonas ramus]
MTLAAMLCATSATAEPLTSAEFRQLSEATFAPVVATYDIPGLAVGVTYQGNSYIYTTGLAVRAPEQPVTEDTLFELGSVSKLFTVALAGLAEERGLLSLDMPVSNVMPMVEGSAFDTITLYDLAAHATGGLPLQVPEEITDDPSLTTWLAAWSPEVDPQRVRSYSNLGIGLLGRISANAFGSDYETALTTELLPALGLEDTHVTVPQAAMSRYAFGYSRSDDRAVRVNPGMLDAEAYGVKSSISDMILFLQAHLGDVDTTPEIAAALAQTRTARYDTAHYAQAMIWEEYSWPVTAERLAAGNSSDMALEPQPLTARSEPLDGPTFLNKTGSTNGFGAYVAMIPQEEIGVVVLANRNYPNAVRAEAALALIRAVLDSN